MKRKMLMLVTVLIAVVSMLSACGSSTKQANNSSTVAETSTPAAGQTVDVKLTAKDFEYDQKEIHVKKGAHVKITLTSDDGGHGFAIPDYNVDIQGNGSAEFTADKSGTFDFHCSVMCGSGHSKMTGKLIVE